MSDNMQIGFLGTGGITEAIVRGMMRFGNPEHSIVVSLRNAQRSTQLAREFPRVQVAAENQTIVDTSAIVVIAVLPEQVPQLLHQLNFRADQVVASLAAGVSLSQVKSMVDPAVRVHRLIPLPPIEFGLGPIPICPPSADLSALFGPLGSIVEITEERQFDTFSAGSAVMAVFFEWTATLARWIQRRGVDGESASVYATSLINALASLADSADPQQLQELSRECLTPGGLNEQVLSECQEHDWFKILERRLDRIEERIIGKHQDGQNSQARKSH